MKNIILILLITLLACGNDSTRIGNLEVSYETKQGIVRDTTMRITEYVNLGTGERMLAYHKF